MSFPARLVAVATMVSALAGCVGPGIRSVNDGRDLPPADPNAPLPPAPARTCAAPLVLEPPRPDRQVEQAAGVRVTNARGWWTRALMGPYADRAEAIADCHDVTTLPAANPFDAIAYCTTANPRRPAGPNNVGRHVLLLRTARGWWRQQLAQDHWPRGNPNDEPRIAQVHDLVASDRLGDGGFEVSAVVEEGPPGGFTSRRLVVCGVGPAAVPACADVKVSASGPLRGAGTLQYRVELTCDGTLSLTGWEGGMSVKLVHTAGRLEFP